VGEREIAKGMTQHILASIDERLKNEVSAISTYETDLPGMRNITLS
jgi:hypothetical protein